MRRMKMFGTTNKQKGETMNRKWSFVSLTFLVAFGLSLPASAQVYSNQSLKGAYALSFDGTFPGPGGVRVPIVGLQRLVFDGGGNYTGDEFFVLPGPTGNDVTPTELVGTYSVHPDGTVEVAQQRFLAGTSRTIKLSDDSLQCAILEVGQEIRCMSTGSEFPGVGPVPVMASGRGRKQHGKNFSQQDFRGNYSVAFAGTLFAPDPTAFRSLGTFFSDGAGNIQALSPFFNNISGQVNALPALPAPMATSTYSVDARGFVQISFPSVQNPPGTKVGEAEFTCLLAGRGEILPCIFARNALLFGSVLVEIPTIGQGTWERLSRARQ